MDFLHETVAILDDLITFATVSSESNLEMVGWLSDRFGRLGARTRISVDPSGHKANLFVTFGPEGDGGIILSGHTDVVPVDGQAWSSDPFRLMERDGRLYGRGTCDMKGFIACVLAVAPRFADRELARPVHIALTYDEEVGCLGARALARELASEGLRPAVAIIGEPTSMRLVEGHKGCHEYTTEFVGLEGHGAAPHSGVNAVEYAVRYARRLLELADELRVRAPDGSRFEPPWTTLQIGRIEGGVAHNVIPGSCRVEWEMRPVCSADAVQVLRAIDDHAERHLKPAMRRTFPGADVRRRVIGEVRGLEPRPQNAAARLVGSLTGAESGEVVAFGTEAGIFQELGIDCVVCGPGSIAQAHKADEFVTLDQLAACLDMLANLDRALLPLPGPRRNGGGGAPGWPGQSRQTGCSRPSRSESAAASSR